MLLGLLCCTHGECVPVRAQHLAAAQQCIDLHVMARAGPTPPPQPRTVRLCSRCLQLRGIVATFRMTARALPTRPSHYVSMILAPLHQFLQARESSFHGAFRRLRVTVGNPESASAAAHTSCPVLDTRHCSHCFPCRRRRQWGSVQRRDNSWRLQWLRASARATCTLRTTRSGGVLLSCNLRLNRCFGLAAWMWCGLLASAMLLGYARSGCFS